MARVKDTMKLTRTKVEQLPAPHPSGKQKLFWDSEHTGLGVLCSGVSSRKTWVVQGKFNGRTKRVKVGPTDRYDPDEAWKKGRPILNDIEDGKDPKAERKREAEASVTVGEVLEAYLTQPRLSPRTVETYREIASRNLAPWLKRSLRSITGQDCEARFAAITKDVVQRKASGKITGGFNVRGAATANFSLRLFGTLWRYQSVRDDTLGKNPIGLLRQQWHKIHRRKRRLWDQDFPRFYQAVMALTNPIHKDLLLLAMHTGLREQEASGLAWSEVDFHHQVIKLPAERMKNREPFDLPMSSFVHDLLVARRAPGDDGPYVFPGRVKGTHTKSFGFALDGIKATTGLQLSPHDMRRTYLSVATNAGISSEAKKRLVGHTTGDDVTEGYVNLSDADVRRAAQRVCDKLIALCGIEAPQAENVTKLG